MTDSPLTELDQSQPHADDPHLDTTVDVRITNAALELLRNGGPLAVSIEAVATTSGVAKTTIYRRHRNREALLRAVVDAASIRIAVPTSLSAYDTFRWFLVHAREMIEHIVGRGAVAAIMLNEDPEFAALLHERIRANTKPLRDNLRERSASGELRADLDIELVMSLLLGTFIAESIRGSSSDDGWADSVLEFLWPALAPEQSSDGL
ncbi:TetR/AcrR family transcriptional regulator [Lacisediminihabitans changchengi]|uniref:TetR/AcrR family transcriptional regulator n=1 Tax=Lacisediminihabitans changchengi TaxID=2787634 RepID=A0A934SPE5_9MICO|nr:TetR/AcrR family transcriptional regulator [Lacisediminihabitans changchengi]MBK4346550.1 TetR/AcrR family transcriptional regulator [Lacisediminihabitans changchengi]